MMALGGVTVCERGTHVPNALVDGGVLVQELRLVDREVVRKSQFHEFTGELTSKVDSSGQWLQLPNPNARRRI